MVYNDLNNNGILDTNEDPLSGVDVTLICNDEIIDTVTTNKSGEYEFNGVQPGSCYISVIPENENYIFSPIVNDEPTGNSIYPNGTSSTIDVEYNTNYNEWNVGLHLPLSTINSVVFNDVNGNGIQDETEDVLPGVDVTLICDSQVVTTVTSRIDGTYTFDNVLPGEECYVSVSNTVDENDNYVFSPIPTWPIILEEGTYNSINQDGNSPSVTIGYNDSIDDWNVGMYLPLSTVGPAPVFNDVDEDGIFDEDEEPIADVPIALICNEITVGTTVTDSNGLYEFTNVQPGEECYIAVTVGENYTISPIAQDGNQVLSDGTSVPTTIGYNTTIDYWLVGMYLPPATIGPNVVFDDRDGNGVRDDENEPPLENVTINLYCYNEDGTAVLEGTATTDANGEYVINDVQPGLCYIQVDPPTSDNETYVFSPIGTFIVACMCSCLTC